MSDKRVIEYDTATELADDDYLVLDSESGGTCKILAKKLEPVKPEYITAVYTQSGTVYDTDELDVLMPDLVVTAYYEDGTVEHNVSGYILSGELTVGESTITCTYRGKSATFTVTVSSSITYLYNWDFTQSLTDSVAGVTAALDGAGISFTQGTGIQFLSQYARLTLPYNGTDPIYKVGNIIEVDISSMNCSFPNSYGSVFFGNSTGTLYWGYMKISGKNVWQSYRNNYLTYDITNSDANIFNGKTLKMIILANDEVEIYANETLVFKGKSYSNSTLNTVYIGDKTGSTAYYNMTITGVRIYENQ